MKHSISCITTAATTSVSCLNPTLFPVNSCPLTSTLFPSLTETCWKILISISFNQRDHLGRRSQPSNQLSSSFTSPSPFFPSSSSSSLLIQLPVHCSVPFIKVVASLKAHCYPIPNRAFDMSWVFKTWFLNHGNSCTYCTLYTLRDDYCFMPILEIRRLRCRKVTLLAQDHTGSNSQPRSQVCTIWLQGPCCPSLGPRPYHGYQK